MGNGWSEVFYRRGASKPVDSSSNSDRSFALLRNPGIDEGEAIGCARFLAGRASDAAELRVWLEMLGLIPYASKPRTEFIPGGQASLKADAS